MKFTHIVLLIACTSLAEPALAANSTYDLLIVACDSTACKRVAEQTVSSGLANAAEYNRDGFRLMIETLVRRTHDEDARISLAVRQTEDRGNALRSTAASLAQRLETLVVQCTLRHGVFSPLTSFVNDGTTYQIWARLAALR